MKILPLILLPALLALTSCKKDISNPISAQPPSTFGQVFEEFWNQLNVNYVYWDIDTTDWDAVHRRYEPVFNGLQLGDTADLARSVSYFRKMTEGLIDHHFSITFTNQSLMDSAVIDPAGTRWRSDPAFRFSYSYLNSDKHYLDTGYLSGFDYTTEPGNKLAAVCGTIHGNILFFTCNQFLLSACYHSPVDNPVKPVLDLFFQRLANPTGLKAILLDLRDNPGGDVNDLNFLAGRFVGQPLRFGYTRNKSGNGRLDYTPWIDAMISPQPGAQTIPIPVIILADKYSQSTAEILVMALRALPNCRVVGETTYGATGPFGANALYDDGPFDVRGFLSVITSSVEFKYIDGKMYEGRGFPPDVPVAFSLQAVGAGHDPQLEKALSMVE